jgi:hypothetical protein
MLISGNTTLQVTGLPPVNCAASWTMGRHFRPCHVVVGLMLIDYLAMFLCCISDFRHDT